MINNVFKRNATPFRKDEPGSQVTRLFWLSQTIGTNRGIEDIVAAMHLLNDPYLELHLFGNLPDGDFRTFIENQDPLQIKIHPPVPPSEIDSIAGQFDIGLAMETAYCLNNDIALSNKIFTYIQAGLAVIASDTTAQREFIDRYPDTGKLYKKKDASMLAACIKAYIDDRKKLYLTRQYNYDLGQTELNWEAECLAFITIVKKTLKEI